jgi:hypothetical protein
MMEIKSNLYEEAISYMKKDVEVKKDGTNEVVVKLDGESESEF